MCKECKAHPRGHAAKEHRAINVMLSSCDEKSRRRVVGFLAFEYGRGGIALMRQITGLSRMTIRRGRDETLLGESVKSDKQVRVVGGGRQTVEKNGRN